MSKPTGSAGVNPPVSRPGPQQPRRFAPDDKSDDSSDGVLEVWTRPQQSQTPPPPGAPPSTRPASSPHRSSPPYNGSRSTPPFPYKQSPPPPSYYQAPPPGNSYPPYHPPPQSPGYSYYQYQQYPPPPPSNHPFPYHPPPPKPGLPPPSVRPYQPPQFESRTSSAPVRFPETNGKKSTPSRIPDDSDDSPKLASKSNASGMAPSVQPPKTEAKNSGKSSAPRPRGRPPKTENKNSEKSSAPRPRGRPPKAGNQSSEKSSAPRPRGRPPKAGNQSSEKSSAPRPRGRPPKDGNQSYGNSTTPPVPRPKEQEPPKKPEKSTVAPSSPEAGENRPKRPNAGKRKVLEVPASKQLRKSSMVDYISEWKPETNSWSETVYHQSKREYTAAGPSLFDHPGYMAFKGRKQKRKRRRKNKKADAEEEPDIPPVHDVQFDRRYLQYDINPLGWLDQLIRPSIIESPRDPRPCESFLENVPDEPAISASSSRIGCQYQARVPISGQFYDKRGDGYLPDYDTIWDPIQADAAEQRGEDIDGFLNGDDELVKKQCLMELLHKCAYCVETARQEYARIVNFSGEPSSKLTFEDGLKFERLLKANKKDFTVLAGKMKRSRSDVMIHYYHWKRTKTAYPDMKCEWKSDYCAICDDGGDMLICDNCERAYHGECLTPPIRKIPAGDWFCPRCKPASPQAVGGRPRRRSTVYAPRQPLSPFSPSLASKEASVASYTPSVVSIVAKPSPAAAAAPSTTVTVTVAPSSAISAAVTTLRFDVPPAAPAKSDNDEDRIHV